MFTVLLLSADAKAVSTFRALARDAGVELVVAGSGAAAARELVRRSVDMLFVQMDSQAGQRRHGFRDGLVFMKEPPVVAFGKVGSVYEAVEAVQAGALAYIPEPPVDAVSFRKTMQSALSRSLAARGPADLLPEGPMPFKGFLTRDYRVLRVCSVAARLANTFVVLLIEGAQGTGKSLLARKVHEASFRCLGPFIEADCDQLRAALAGKHAPPDSPETDSAIADRLLAHWKHAAGGTLLLSGVTQLSPLWWRVLLRTLRQAAPQGGGKAWRPAADVRLIVAARVPLEESKMRQLMLAYGACPLGAVRVKLPPLKERLADVPILAEHFMKVFSSKYGRKAREIAPEAMAKLVRYSWPGNVQELHSAIERSVLSAHKETIRPQDLPLRLEPKWPSTAASPAAAQIRPLKAALREPERRHILYALEKTGWNKQQAAAKLDISRSTLYKKINQHHLEGEFDTESQDTLSDGKWISVVDVGSDG